MTTRYICNRVGDQCLSKDNVLDGEGFEDEKLCNNVCSEHIWKYTLDELVQRTQRVVANGAYHSQRGLNLGHIKEMVMAMSEHNGETPTETLGYDPKSTLLWLYQDRKEWITKMKAYIIQSNVNSEQESDNLSMETAALVRSVHKFHTITSKQLSQSEFDQWFNSKTHIEQQRFCKYIKQAHNIACNDLRKSRELIQTAYKYIRSTFAKKETFRYPILDLFYEKMNEKKHNMYLYDELTTIKMEWLMVAKYALKSTDSLHYWWRAGWLTSPGVSDPLVSYSEESGDRYINGYLDIADSELEAKEEDKKSLITKINKTTRRNHYLENWNNVITYINNIDWYFLNKAHRTEEPMFVVRYADYVKNLETDNYTVWKRYLSTTYGIRKLLGGWGGVSDIERFENISKDNQEHVSELYTKLDIDERGKDGDYCCLMVIRVPIGTPFIMMSKLKYDESEILFPRNCSMILKNISTMSRDGDVDTKLFFVDLKYG